MLDNPYKITQNKQRSQGTLFALVGKIFEKKTTRRTMNAFLKEHFHIIVIVIVFLMICGTCLNNIIIYTPDSARYVAWAKSLSDFNGYYDDTTADPSRHVIHGPLYPVFLAPAALFFPNGVIAAKIVTSLFGALTIVLFYLWLKGKIGEHLLVIGCLTLALNPLFILFSTQVLSDVPFLAFVIMLFLFMEKSSETLSVRQAISILVVVSAGYFLREVGLAMVLTVVLWYGLRKDYKYASLFFAIPCLLILLWVLRNKMIVGPLDVPTANNFDAFFAHFFTSPQASIFAELKERFLSHSSVYKSLVGLLIFLPGFAAYLHGTATIEAPPISLAISYVHIMHVPIVLFTLGIAAFGFFWVWKTSVVPKMSAMFLGFYALAILLYPVNDIRFLFPLLVIFLFFFIIGTSRIGEFVSAKVGVRLATTFSWVAALVLLIPNVTWVADHVNQNILYQRIDRQRNSDELKRLRPSYGRAMDVAGKFIVEHSDPSALVGTARKELAFWLDGRKIVELSPQTTVDEFDYLLRDYDVRYLTSVEGVTGLRQFEVQMTQSRRFTFRNVARFGAIHVLRVENKQGATKNSSPRRDIDSTKDEEWSMVASQLRDGLNLLESEPARAELVFRDLWNKKGGFATIAFYTALAKEFSDSLDRARSIFRRFGSLEQAGVFLSQAAFHLQIIAGLQEARALTNPLQRAEKYQWVALNYWELGYRKRAVEMIRRSVATDESFFPSLIFGSLYCLQVGDTAASRQYLQKAAALEPENELGKNLSAFFQYTDSLKRGLRPEMQERIKLALAERYVLMGLRENAIDELLLILKEDPQNQEALRLLADIYLLKRRFAPARNILGRLVALDPDDELASKQLEEVSRKWF